MPHSRNRYITQILLQKLMFSPVLAVQGARQTGKSFLMRQIVLGELPNPKYVTFDRPSDRALAAQASEAYLEKFSDCRPIIIDEAQKVPVIFDTIKYLVDQDRRPGKFVLLGSTEFSKKTLIRESLTGRISAVRVYPFTCAEALQLPLNSSSSCFSIAKTARCDRKDFMRHLQRGGMPGIFGIHSERERDVKLKEWLEMTVYRDLSLIPKVKLEPDLAMAILREIATIEEPTAGNIAKKLRRDLRRIKTHLECLELLFAVHRLSPIEESTGKPLYFLCDVGFAQYFEADWERSLHTWLVQEVMARKEWATNVKETIGFYRSTKGTLAHLVVKHSRTEWQAIKIIPNERFSEKDTWSLSRLKENLPKSVTLTLTALASAQVKFKDVECVPWEAVV